MKRNPALVFAAAAAFLGFFAARGAPQEPGDKNGPPPQGKKGFGRGAPKRGPAGPLPRLSDGHPDLTAIWNGFGGSGQTPSLQPWAAQIVAQRRAANGAEDYEARCLPGGPPRAAPYHTALFATPKLVLMLFEGNTHMYRQFFVDGSGHPGNLKPTFYGDSRAHWDGDTFVVDTTGLRDGGWLDTKVGRPHSDALRVTERFHRVNFGRMELQLTLDDPETFTRPVSLKFNLLLLPDTDLIESFCAEDEKDLKHVRIQ